MVKLNEFHAISGIEVISTTTTEIKYIARGTPDHETNEDDIRFALAGPSNIEKKRDNVVILQRRLPSIKYLKEKVRVTYRSVVMMCDDSMKPYIFLF